MKKTIMVAAVATGMLASSLAMACGCGEPGCEQTNCFHETVDVNWDLSQYVVAETADPDGVAGIISETSWDITQDFGDGDYVNWIGTTVTVDDPDDPFAATMTEAWGEFNFDLLTKW